MSKCGGICFTRPDIIDPLNGLIAFWHHAHTHNSGGGPPRDGSIRCTGTDNYSRHSSLHRRPILEDFSEGRLSGGAWNPQYDSVSQFDFLLLSRIRSMACIEGTRTFKVTTTMITSS